MSGFKGTKGKWVVYDYEPVRETPSLFGLAGHCIGDHETFLAYGRNSDQTKANALIISKATEMLEMLEELLLDLESEIFSTSMNDTINRAKKLIKEATEL